MKKSYIIYIDDVQISVGTHLCCPLKKNKKLNRKRRKKCDKSNKKQM